MSNIIPLKTPSRLDWLALGPELRPAAAWFSILGACSIRQFCQSHVFERDLFVLHRQKLREYGRLGGLTGHTSLYHAWNALHEQQVLEESGWDVDGQPSFRCVAVPTSEQVKRLSTLGPKVREDSRSVRATTLWLRNYSRELPVVMLKELWEGLLIPHFEDVMAIGESLDDVDELAKILQPMMLTAGFSLQQEAEVVSLAERFEPKE